MPFLSPFFGGVFIVVLLGLAALGFNIWMLIDAARRPETDFEPPNSRIWWIVGLAVGIFLGWLGFAVALVYYFLVRKPLHEGKPPAQIFGGGGGSSGGGNPFRPSGAAPGRQGKAGRTCRTCGEPLGTHARFCQNCGTPAELEDR